jgi:hypothetical protein
VLAGKLVARRSDCAPLAGKSTLNRLEHAPAAGPTRYHKVGHDPAAIERLFVDLFIEAHAKASKQIILDLDATASRLNSSVNVRRVFVIQHLLAPCGAYRMCPRQSGRITGPPSST